MAESTDVRRDADVEADTVLEARDLTKKFGEVVANDAISLSVKRGEMRSIIGPNGAGKTTFFNLITGVLAPTDGTVHFKGEDVTGVSIEDRAQRGLGRSYQSNELFFDRTAFENVRIAAQTAELGSFSFDVFSRADTMKRDRAEALIERLSLTDERNTKARNLSHGDQRRLGIAISLATDPDLLLLDEPTSGMGPEATDETAELIRTIGDELGISIVLIEHDMSVVMGISDRISVLYNGEHIATGTPEEIRGNEDVQDAYLGGLKEGIE
ncbi:ABC transporter ATP-binding protein [Halomarina halobia]|uniref:Probable branched-chain amino acid transport ATP-binding protein LivG n=1 Tax=Halomarina halobia TaxID=3033386 RepID=A0ABD6AGB1_9EURY|nr:ABC transporter ATP-binding protein [Halomarina sp. PSR21]